MKWNDTSFNSKVSKRIKLHLEKLQKCKQRRMKTRVSHKTKASRSEGIEKVMDQCFQKLEFISYLILEFQTFYECCKTIREALSKKESMLKLNEQIDFIKISSFEKLRDKQRTCDQLNQRNCCKSKRLKECNFKTSHKLGMITWRNMNRLL